MSAIVVAGTAPSTPHRSLALGVLALGVFLVTLNVTVVIAALPVIGSDLGASAAESAWIVDGYNLVVATLLLSAGSLADRFGRKRLLSAGYLLFGVGALLCAIAPGEGTLIAARVVQAVGGTVLTPASLAIVAGLYPERAERARALGVWSVASGIGLGLGPVIGGGIAEGLGWRAVFVVNAAVALGALAAVRAVVPRSRGNPSRRLDPVGQVLAAGALGALTYAIIEAPERGWGSPTILGCLAAAVALGVLFVGAERRIAMPLIDLGAFRDRQFAGTIAVTLTAFFGLGAFLYATALALQTARGYSPLEAGLLTLPAALPILAGGPISGRLVARRGPRGVLASGLLLMAAGLALLGLSPADLPIAAVLVCFAVLGAGYAIVNVPVTTIAVASLPADRSAVASAIASSARNIGLVVGVAVAGTLLAGDGSGAGLVGLGDDARHVYVAAAGVALAGSLIAATTARRGIGAPPGRT